MNDNSFKQYRRSQIAELRPFDPETDVEQMRKGTISVSLVDQENGSPTPGDMIARNPANHDDQWLVAKKYFADNFEPMPEDETEGLCIHGQPGTVNCPTVHEQTSSKVSSLAAHYLGQNDRELEILIEADRPQVMKDIRTLAGSALTQDETPQPETAKEI